MPVPGGADALEVLDRDQRSVARPAPALHVAAHRRLARLGDAIHPPVVRMPQHVAHERHVLRAGRADHGSSWASWSRLPSGSKTSTSRIAPWSSSTVPTSTPAWASRSRSAFDVVDVDGRDRPFLVGRLVGLADGDLGRAAVERRPAFLLVDEHLGEAEHVPIERPRSVEIRDAVPDPHNIRAGSSSSSLTVWRKSAAGAPSTARWSKVPVIVIVGRTTTSPSTRDRPLLGRADRDDRGLRRVQHGGEALDAVHAEVRDREGAVLEVAALELALARPGDDVRAGGGDLGQAQSLGAVDHRHDETLRRRHGDADVRGREEQDRLVGVLRVHLAVAQQARRRRPSSGRR